jgi:CubicO group peptidase (beta-lactamase class C family)
VNSSPDWFDGIVHRNFARLAVGNGNGGPDQMPGILVGVATTTGNYYFKFGDVPLFTSDKVATEDIVMFIGSNTKVITATLLALAQFQPTTVMARLRTDVARLLPSGITINVCDQCPNQDCPIKLWHLATHSAGFPDELCGQVTFGDYPFAQLGNFLNVFQPPYAPGAAWNYSDLGFALLGVLLSHAYTPQSATTTTTTDPWDATYQNWPAIAAQNILKPLGMKSTQVGFPTVMGRLAIPFAYNNQGNYDEVPPPEFIAGTAALGAGSLSSTLRDMLSFLQNQLAPNPDDHLGKAISLTQVPWDGGTLSMGLGWQMGNNFLYKNGLIPGYASFMAFDSLNGFAVIAMANSLARGSLATASLGTLGDLRGYEAVPTGMPQANPKPTCPKIGC